MNTLEKQGRWKKGEVTPHRAGLLCAVPVRGAASRHRTGWLWIRNVPPRVRADLDLGT